MIDNLFNRFCLAYTRRSLIICKYLANLTGSPLWRIKRDEAAAEVLFWEGVCLTDQINEGQA